MWYPSPHPCEGHAWVSFRMTRDTRGMHMHIRIPHGNQVAFEAWFSPRFRFLCCMLRFSYVILYLFFSISIFGFHQYVLRSATTLSTGSTDCTVHEVHAAHGGTFAGYRECMSHLEYNLHMVGSTCCSTRVVEKCMLHQGLHVTLCTTYTLHHVEVEKYKLYRPHGEYRLCRARSTWHVWSTFAACREYMSHLEYKVAHGGKYIL